MANINNRIKFVSYKKVISVFLIFLCILVMINHHDTVLTTSTKNIIMDQYMEKQITLYGILEIPNIKVKQPIYPKNAKENNVDKNIMLLEETDKFIALAAHSGNGIHAYFRDLNKISLNDKILLFKENKTYEYVLDKKEEVIKNGTVEIEIFETNYLILITCSKTKDNIQEVYYAKLSKIY